MNLMMSLLLSLMVLGCAAPNPVSAVQANKPLTTAEKILAGAKRQVEEGAAYDASYYRISYPGGDLPRSKGACTDVVIRALRNAGFDLQKLIHEDMLRDRKGYPRKEAKPDSNIDHRRVPNQLYFFSKYGLKLSTDPKTSDWHPGDIVAWKLPGGLDHIGIISDRKNTKRQPLVIHNLATCVEEDALTSWKIVAHYRYPRR